MTYEDHFSRHADAYALHRPRYPNELFAWLASLTLDHSLAWDAGTGNGQVAVALADHFDRVLGTDASSDQLARAERHERVEYRHEPADRGSLPNASVDLITAGAAAHWFELDGFYTEVRRVAKQGAAIALFSYGPRDFADVFARMFGERTIHRFHENVLAGYWPERIQYVNERYATLPFPFEEIAASPFAMTADWNLRDVLAVLDTWSAAQRYLRERGTRAIDEIAPALARAWGDPERRYHFECPLFMRVGRV